MLGTKIESFVLLRLAARGSMSEVFEARCEHTGSVAAVKLLLPHLLPIPEMVSRFVAEAQLLQQLHHPHVVKWLGGGHSGERPFLALEWLHGTLHDTLSERSGGLAVDRALVVGSQLADALSFLHGLGIVHRDLKPTNVLLDDPRCTDGRVRLADLGLAKQTRLSPPLVMVDAAVSTNNSTLLGTWEYMAPEQWVHSKSVDARADVYALGALLFHLLVGRPPFAAAERKDLMYYHIVEEPPFGSVPLDVPADIVTLMRRMLSKKAAHRPEMPEVFKRLSGSPGYDQGHVDARPWLGAPGRRH